jgi:hypothetical protein
VEHAQFCPGLHPTVLFEVGYQNLRPFGILPSDLYRFFEDVGYQVLNLERRALSESDFAHACIAEHEFVGVPDAYQGHNDRRCEPA